jgi:hypothetical protein
MFKSRTICNKVIVICLLAMLTACGSFQKQPEVVVKTEYKTVTIPAEYLNNCEITQPPSKTKYLALGDKGREDLLVSYGIELTKDLKNCNIQIDKARKFQIEMLNKLKEK